MTGPKRAEDVLWRSGGVKGVPGMRLSLSMSSVSMAWFRGSGGREKGFFRPGGHHIGEAYLRPRWPGASNCSQLLLQLPRSEIPWLESVINISCGDFKFTITYTSAAF
jgi:hypothetical protein